MMKHTDSIRYHATVQAEFSVGIDGKSYLVIYGTHVNGGFCCIPNWGFACEMGDADDVLYNTTKLEERFGHGVAETLAHCISTQCTPSSFAWVENEDGIEVCGRCGTTHTVTDSGNHLLSPHCPSCGAHLRNSKRLGFIRPSERFQQKEE